MQDKTSTPQAAIAAAVEREVSVATELGGSYELLAAFPITYAEQGAYGVILAGVWTRPDGSVRGAVDEVQPVGNVVIGRGTTRYTDVPADAVPLAIELAGWSGVRS